MTKVINISIPDKETIPEIIATFSPEENFIMLKIGCECLREGRNAVVNMSQKEIYNKIKDETSEELKRLELDIIVQQEMSKKMEQHIEKIYKGQVEKLEKQIEILSIQINEQENIKKNFIDKEVEKVREKYDLLLQEKDKQNQLNREIFDKAEKLISKSNSKTSIAIGDDGEQLFENLADTFKDFAGYKIENKAKQGHKGDFHLFFEEFNVLVDSKNYSGSVQKKEIKKIESDLMVNDNMNYAWLVSLNSNVCEYNRFPIMTKWITTDVGVKCILFINNLLEHKDPKNILRQAWSICEDFYRLTKNLHKEDGELAEYRERNLFLKKHINNLQDRASEIRRGINVLHNSLKNLDTDLLEVLSLISDDIVTKKVTLDNIIKKWWDNNIEYVNDDSKMTSTEIWNKFKKENKEYIRDNKVTIEKFKDIITSNIVNISTYTEKTKKSSIEFIGFKWKEITIKEIKELIIENAIIEKPKEKITEMYFDEEKDKKILQEYDNIKNDILSISLNNNIKPFEIISLLVKYKIISKRGDARGYDKYKDTEEYKNKLNKK